jgi:predicted AlkP superfamily phosphohydrolase/phosphomutase
MASFIRPRVKELYKKLDGAIGDIAGDLPSDTHLMIVSDHGFGGTEAYFNVNQWLADHGWLRVKPLAGLKKRLFFAAMQMNDRRWVKSVLPRSFQSWFRGKIRGTRSSFKSDLEASIDWDHTRAFFPSIPCQGIYLTKPDATLLSEIETELRKLTDDSGKLVVDNIWRGTDLYQGPQSEYSPDLVFLMRDYRILGRPLLNIGEWFSPALNQPLGFHRSQGVLFGLGSAIQPGHIVGAKIEDTTPTVLYLMGEPIPEQLDGCIIPGLVSEESLREKPPRFSRTGIPTEGDAESEISPESREYSPEEERSVEARLRALGYLG